MKDTAGSSGTTRSRTIGAVSFLIVLASLSAGLFLIASNSYQVHRVQKLITEIRGGHRLGEGRLFLTPYLAVGAANFPGGNLGRAQLLLLDLPDSDTRRELQGAIHLASGNWQASAETLAGISTVSHDPSILNDLGVAFLALGETETLKLFEALDYFERAAQLAPMAQEPLFNLVVLYRKLRLTKLAEETFQKYVQLDRDSKWAVELLPGPSLDESDVHDRLTVAAEARDFSTIEATCSTYTELCRRIAMQNLLRNEGESKILVRHIADTIERRYGDKTVSAMLTPLSGKHREMILQVRMLVEEGGRLYLQSRSADSLAAYTKAEELVEQTDSVFDRYWIEINRVDTQIRAGQFDIAREALDHVTKGARQHQWQWLLARALTISGSAPGLVPSLEQMIKYLDEAEKVYLSIGSKGDTVRPLYYLAALRHAAGDHDESLSVATECLRLAEPTDAIRLASLYWIMGSVLYKKGLPARAALFELESIEQAKNSGNPVLLSASTSTLALLYESMSEHAATEQYLKDTENALELIQPSVERTRAQINANLLKSRILLNRNRYAEAETPLEENLALYSNLLVKPTYLRAQSLMLLAKVYSATSRTDKARHTFRQAIDLVENSDAYIQSEKLRLTFDDERRELYDSAIAFEYDNNEPELAWNYLQKYRAKMFLEFLAAFNPDIERVRGDALVRPHVQKSIPKDVQVLEYVLLSDRLLIWVTSKDLFTSRTVAVARMDLDAKIQDVLTKLRSEANVDSLSRELYTLLIAPIADLLDPQKALAIIPDGSLHGLPFAAIRYPDKPDYLIEHYPIIVSPSLTHLLAANGEKPVRNSLVSFGGQSDDVSSFRELAALRKMYSSVTTAAGKDVEKALFLKAMNTASIFHYAGHSAYDAVDPLRSSILLDGNRYGPNSVTAVDISQQRLRPNAVIVLSSCDSSVGNSRDGIGMRGLTSAFLIGGAGSVVGSLWPVETSSTSNLMIGFHDAFATSRMPVAHALRHAQLSFLKSFPEKSHPYYWSGFVVTGNLNALR